MAFIILSDGKFYRSAATQADADDVNISPSSKSTIDISDADHLSFITNLKKVSISGNTATFTALESERKCSDADDLAEHFEIITDRINAYLKYNSSKQLATKLETYKNYLAGVDKSSLTYPINWEKYCSDNSITFYSIHQIG